MGFSEAMVGSGSFYLPYLLNPVPLVNYALSLADRAGRGENDNYAFALDADWLLRPGVLAYGEVLFDDIVFSGIYPSRVGGTVGLFLADPLRDGRTSLRLEYAAVTNWLYATTDGGNTYVFRSRSLGHWIALDGDMLAVIVTRRVSPEASIQLMFQRLRKGEGELGRIWISPEEAWSRLFLSGVVETTQTWQIMSTWSAGSHVSHAVSLSWATVTNPEHQAGQTRQGLLFWWEARFGF